MIGFNEAPDGELTLFSADVEAGTHIVFLNGLMQLEGEDFFVNPGVDTALSIQFNSAPAATDRLNVYGVVTGTTMGDAPQL